MMKKLLAIAAAAMLLLTAAGKLPPEVLQPKPEPFYRVTVVSVTLSEAPSAVVSLSPGTTEMVYDLGYGDLLAGVSEYCTNPSSAAAMPRMGSVYQPEMDKI